MFEILHYFGRRGIGRGTNQNMDVIRPNVALDHLHLIGGTDLSDYVPQSQGGVASRNTATLLDLPYKVIFEMGEGTVLAT